MYISLKVLKKLMKEAYKGAGLVAGILPGGMVEDIRTNGLYMCSGPWALWLDASTIPNPLKGFLVELAGGFPTNGEMIRIAKHLMTPQSLDLDEVAKHKKTLRKMSEVGEGSEILPLQYTGFELDLIRTKESRHLFGVRSDLMLLIDVSECDMNESDPIGPIFSDDGLHVFWNNEHCMLLLEVAAIDLNLIQDALAWLDVKGVRFIEHQYTMPPMPGTDAENTDEQPETADNTAGEEDGTDEENTDQEEVPELDTDDAG